jgi:c-di-AMP phosphodiesterase-like protein
LLGLHALNIFYLTPKDESSYTIMIFIFILILIFAHLFKTKDDVLQRYLEKLQKKLDVEKNYKQLIDELQEGIIIIDKKFSILYNNMTANTIFGIEPSSSLEEKLVMLEVQDLLIIECK